MVDGLSSTHTADLFNCATILSDDEDIKRGSKKQLPDSTNLQRMEIATERTSQKKTLISCIRILLSLPPWVLTTPMQLISMGHHYPHGSTHADPFAFVYLFISAFFELHFQIFQTLEGFEQRSGPLDFSAPITKTHSAWAAGRRKNVQWISFNLLFGKLENMQV